MLGLFSTWSLVSETSRRFDSQSGRPFTEMGEISTAVKPAAGVDREVTDAPRIVVEVNLIYNTELAVCGSNRKALQIFCVS